MKIEICEQVVQSWLKHIKLCQIVQTNWTMSPILANQISEELYTEINEFIDVIKNDDKLKEYNIFKQSTTRQMLLQCEIDVVGVEIKESLAKNLYMIDTAFHEAGLNYGDTIPRVIKKIIRSVFISRVIYPTTPCSIIFASPKCGYQLKEALYEKVVYLNNLVHSYYPEISVSILTNEEFSNEIFQPVMEMISQISDDNDLFLRSIQLFNTAESYKKIGSNNAKTRTRQRFDIDDMIFVDDEKSETSTRPNNIPEGYTYIDLNKTKNHTTKTPRGANKDIVFSILNNLKTNGKLSPTILQNLTSSYYTKRTFDISSFPVLLPLSQLKTSGFERNRFYGELFEIDGKDYLVCSQWVPHKIKYLKHWYEELK